MLIGMVIGFVIGFFTMFMSCVFGMMYLKSHPQIIARHVMQFMMRNAGKDKAA